MNPVALIAIAFCAVVGALLGSWLAGLAVGLGTVLLAELLSD